MINCRQRKYGLNKTNMTGVIGLGSGRVKEDVCTLSKQVAEEDTGGGSRSKFM